MTYVEDADALETSTPTGSCCTFPGGTIVSTATVFADGMDSMDGAFVVGQAEPVYNFRRTLKQ